MPPIARPRPAATTSRLFRILGIAALLGALRFRDGPAEVVETDAVGIGSAAHAGLERVDGGHLLGRQLEIEDIEVFGDPGRLDRLRDHRAALLRPPTEHDLAADL